jgi:lipoate-protein ligase A
VNLLHNKVALVQIHPAQKSITTLSGFKILSKQLTEISNADNMSEIMIDQPAQSWRLIVTPPLPGAENMAIDEALLRSFDPAASPPTLRLYGWNPPTLSLGRFQKAAEVLDLERCRADGTAIVRRITGGGVIYHADELTYSLVCTPEQIPPATSIKDSFRVLTGFLLAFYRTLGLEAAYAADVLPEGTRLGERTPFCFAGKESFDILAGGRKIGGNAQRRLKGVIFQHGSIPLLNRAAAGLSYMRERAPELAEDVVSLAECGVTAKREILLCRLATAFGTYFGCRLLESQLSAGEEADMSRLLTERYLSGQWNMEGTET